MPTAIACGESYNCPCGAWRWVESARAHGEKKCTKCGRPFRSEYIGLRPLGKQGRPAGAKAKATAKAKPKAKAKAHAQGQRGGGATPAAPWAAAAAGRAASAATPSPTGKPSGSAGSGDREDVLRETLAVYARHGYAETRSEVQATKAELAELLRERQARMPPAERVAHIQDRLQSVNKDLARSEERAIATNEEVRVLQERLKEEDRRVLELQGEVEELEAALAVAQRALPPSLRPLPVGRLAGGAGELEEDLDMVLGKPEAHVLAQYSEEIDDTAKEMLRSITAGYADKIHGLAPRDELGGKAPSGEEESYGGRRGQHGRRRGERG